MLTCVEIALVVPGYHKETVLVKKNTYLLSTDDGEDLPVNISDVVTGHFSFKYMGQGIQRIIAMKYNAKLPFTGPDPVEGIISLCPT